MTVSSLSGGQENGSGKSVNCVRAEANVDAIDRSDRPTFSMRSCTSSGTTTVTERVSERVSEMPVTISSSRADSKLLEQDIAATAKCASGCESD